MRTTLGEFTRRAAATFVMLAGVGVTLLYRAGAARPKPETGRAIALLRQTPFLMAPDVEKELRRRGVSKTRVLFDVEQHALPAGTLVEGRRPGSSTFSPQLASRSS